MQINIILKVIPVIKPLDASEDFKINSEAYTGNGILFNSKFLNGLKYPEESVFKTIEILEKKIRKKKN